MRAKRSVLTVEPSDIICEGLRVILEESGNYNVLSPLHDASILEERLPVMRPDLLIINPTLLTVSPRQQLASMMQVRPEMAVAALVYQYVEAGVLELFSHTIDIRMGRSEMLGIVGEAIAEAGGRSETQESADENYELSERETDVLVLVAKGLSSKEIADQLNISVHTVNSHRKNITHKTGIKSVAGLAVYAMIHNLIV